MDVLGIPSRFKREFRRLVANHKYDYDDEHNLLIGNLSFKNYQEVVTTDNPTPRRYPNLVTEQGANHFLDVVLHEAVQVSTWYVAPFGNNVTVDNTLTAANFHATLNELSTAYSEGTRPAFIEVAAAGGSTNNIASPAVITAAEASVSIWGAGMMSSPTKLYGTSPTVLLFVSKYISVEQLNSIGNTLGIKWVVNL